MTGKNQNYNSIIFLTTLSVYLGLVLVSGTPQVFAYAATTKNFEIQHEIEFKDDLDNKPESDGLADFRVRLASQDEHFIKQYVQLISSTLREDLWNIGFSADRDDNRHRLDAKFVSFPELRCKDHDCGFDFSANSIGPHVDPAQFESPDICGSGFDSLDPNNQPVKVTSQNTKVTFENKQFLVVTNLPRAGIDSLPKQ